MTDSGEVYKSKKDWWIVALVVFAMVMMIATGFNLLLTDGAPDGSYAVGLLSLLAAGFCAWVLFGTRYVLDREELRVYCGPMRIRVKLAEIERAYPTHNPLSSPALSLDRIMIKSGKWRGVMISPEDKDAFLRRLRLLQPELRPDGKGGLERRTLQEGELLDV